MFLECVVGLCIDSRVAIHDYCVLDKNNVTALHEVVDHLGIVDDVLCHENAMLVKAAAHFKLNMSNVNRFPIIPYH